MTLKEKITDYLRNEEALDESERLTPPELAERLVQIILEMSVEEFARSL